jgi:hypothetical protein
MVIDPVLNEPAEGQGAEHHKPPKAMGKKHS